MITRALRHARPSFAALLALVLAGLPSPSQARDTLTWLLRDFPPLTIFSGPQAGLGAIDRLMPLLIARMPEYDHELMKVNRARGMQMLQDPHQFVCDPTLLWTDERASIILYSIPVYATQGNGVTLRRADLARYADYIDQGEIDLAGVLSRGEIKVGIVAERSYGPVIDNILRQTTTHALNVHYGNDAVGSLLAMQRMGRLQAVLGYSPETRFQAQYRGMDPDELVFLRVKGTPKYQFAHIGCSNTAQGRQAMEIINREMRTLRQNELVKLYAEWLTPDQRADYLKDAQAFFDEAGHGEWAKETPSSGETARGKP